MTPSEVKFDFVTETVTSAALVPSTFATVILFILLIYQRTLSSKLL